MDEEEAYEQINEKFGFYPIKLLYLPEDMVFVEGNIYEELQMAQFHYQKGNDKSISYRIYTDYRSGSVGVDVEDTLVGEYEKELEKANVVIKEYEIEEDKSSRWIVTFVYKDAQYTMILTGIDKEEVEKMEKRGRPKKQEVSETMVIENDKQFDEVLSRAEKLMRKSESGLSESQSKRIEKEIKMLMDAMNRYKESK